MWPMCDTPVTREVLDGLLRIGFLHQILHRGRIRAQLATE
jgi:hypothetical protein